MSRNLIKSLVTFLSLLYINSAVADAIVLGLNLEFTDGNFSEEAFDGGWGIHAGYEFKTWNNWNFGAMFEYMNGWYAKEDLDIEGEMRYDSKSLYATARPKNWPLLFKAGFVDADYSVLLQSGSKNFREENDIGYGYGVSVVLGGEGFRIDVLDVKRIKIGSDTFTSYGITITVLAGLNFN